MIKDVLGVMAIILLSLGIMAKIIDVICYLCFYKKYDKILGKYKYIVGYKDKEDIIINSKFDGDVYVAYNKTTFSLGKELEKIDKLKIVQSVDDFKRLLKDEALNENEAAYELHFSSFDDDDTTKEHIVYVISNVYYTPKDTKKILKSLKEMTK